MHSGRRLGLGLVTSNWTKAMILGWYLSIRIQHHDYRFIYIHNLHYMERNGMEGAQMYGELFKHIDLRMKH